MNMEPLCPGQCEGCALRRGAAANVELDNRMTAAIAALGGIPFLCHDALGWKGKRTAYPVRKSRITAAHVNLMTAPTLIHNSPQIAACISDATPTGVPAAMFAKDRKILGRRPTCGGWRAAVADLARQGWFADPEARRARRKVAKEALLAMSGMKAKEPAAVATLDNSVKWLFRELREAKVKFEGFK